MGKNKSSNPAERKLIWNYFQKWQKVKKIAKILDFSACKVRNAIAHYKKNGSFENIPRQIPRKTTKADDRRIVSLSRADPFLSSSQIRAQMEAQYGVKVSSQTIRRRTVGPLYGNNGKKSRSREPVERFGWKFKFKSFSTLSRCVFLGFFLGPILRVATIQTMEIFVFKIREVTHISGVVVCRQIAVRNWNNMTDPKRSS